MNEWGYEMTREGRIWKSGEFWWKENGETGEPEKSAKNSGFSTTIVPLAIPILEFETHYRSYAGKTKFMIKP